MPKQKTPSSKSRAARHSSQYERLLIEIVEMRPCSLCINRGVRCIAHRSSDKCAECINAKVLCDLVVSDEDWFRLNSERDEVRDKITNIRRTLDSLSKEISKATAELAKCLDLESKLQKKSGEMLARENQNLKEMEEDASRSSDPIFDPFDPELSAFFESVPFDWGSFGCNDPPFVERSSNA